MRGFRKRKNKHWWESPPCLSPSIRVQGTDPISILPMVPGMAVVPTDFLPTAALKRKGKVTQGKRGGPWKTQILKWKFPAWNAGLEWYSKRRCYLIICQNPGSCVGCTSKPKHWELFGDRRKFIPFGQSKRMGEQDLSNPSPQKAQVGSYYVARGVWEEEFQRIEERSPCLFSLR